MSNGGREFELIGRSGSAPGRYTHYYFSEGPGRIVLPKLAPDGRVTNKDRKSLIFPPGVEMSSRL